MHVIPIDTNQQKMKAFIFDWGGVLMRTVDPGPRHDWDNRLGMPLGTTEALVHGSDTWRQAQLGKIGIDEYWNNIGTVLKLDAVSLSNLRNDFYRGDRLDEDLISFIRGLREQSFPIGLLSNHSLDLLHTLSEMRLADLFDSIIISAQTGIMKPDTGSYKAILASLNVQSRDALFIDDSFANIKGATALGMSAILYSNTMSLKDGITSWLNK
jgi:HAD superfamily hydrolase (TIGR01509 family)